jgi:hypothetical protein
VQFFYRAENVVANGFRGIGEPVCETAKRPSITQPMAMRVCCLYLNPHVQ